MDTLLFSCLNRWCQSYDVGPLLESEVSQASFMSAGFGNSWYDSLSEADDPRTMALRIVANGMK